jgi:hypothetical protein
MRNFNLSLISLLANDALLSLTKAYIINLYRIDKGNIYVLKKIYVNVFHYPVLRGLDNPKYRHPQRMRSARMPKF